MTHSELCFKEGYETGYINEIAARDCYLVVRDAGTRELTVDGMCASTSISPAR